MVGRIVCSKAGRDKGYFMVVTANSYKSDKALRRCLAVLRDKAEKEEP